MCSLQGLQSLHTLFGPNPGAAPPAAAPQQQLQRLQLVSQQYLLDHSAVSACFVSHAFDSFGNSEFYL
jgi:hypothetical protein